MTIPPHCQRPEPQHLLVLQVAVMVLFAAMGLAAYLLRDRDDTLAAAVAEAQGATRLLDEYARRTVEGADLLLAAAELVPSPERIADIATVSRRLPEAVAVAVTDASGRGLAVRENGEPYAVDISSHVHFRRLAAAPGQAGVSVGPMLRTRSGKLAFTVARPRFDANGRFAGVANVLISAGPFEKIFRNLGLGPNATMTVLNRDGDFVLRQPAPDGALGLTAAQSTVWKAAASQPEGVIRAVSAVDGVERICAYRTIDDLGIVVATGLSVEDTLRPWRSRALIALTIFAIVVLAVGGLTLLAYRSLRREQTTLRGLEAEVRLRTEEARARAEQARRAEATKTRFLAAASHDLRQPLQAMEMFAEVLAGQLTSPGQHQAFGHLRTALDSANQLLTTLLDASALDAGKVEPAVRDFPLTEVFAALASQIAPLAARKGLNIRVVDTSASVTTDPTLLERLLRNLLVNAVRYTQTGGVLLGCRRSGSHMTIQVVDTGVGIPADKLAVVFEDFTRLVEGRGEGRGLGLSVVRQMASLLDLHLSVASAPGRGSIFSVRVPLAMPVQCELCITGAPL